MADPLICVDSELTRVEPGGQASVTVTLTNPGTVVEGYELQVLGSPAGWAQVAPPEVSVYPQKGASVAVVFSPPAGTSAPGGKHSYGIIARSTLDPQFSAVAEGDVEVGQVHGLQAKIVPVNSTGWMHGRHAIQVSNWGNAPVELTLTASDPDDLLDFTLSPPAVRVLPGGSESVRISARARRPLLRGVPVRMPFQVVGEEKGKAPGPTPPGLGYGDPSRPVVDASFKQKPIFSNGVIALLALVVAAVTIIGIDRLNPVEPTVQTLGHRSAPPKPENLKVAAKGLGSVVAQWGRVRDATYTVEVADRGGGTSPKNVSAGDTNTYTATGLPAATEVCIKVMATRNYAPSEWSDQVCATTKAKATAPINTTAPAMTWADGRDFEWGVTVSVDPGSWQAAGPEFTYSWLRCTTTAGPCSEIAQADKKSYRLGLDDIDKVIGVKVSTSNKVGGTTAEATRVGPVLAGSGEIPTLLEQTLASATARAHEKGYRIHVASERVDCPQVATQDPQPGASVAHGQTIAVTTRQADRCFIIPVPRRPFPTLDRPFPVPSE